MCELSQNIKRRPYAATIGMFDGVHLGHQSVINQMLDYARSNNLLTMVVTFRNHPLSILKSRKVPPQLLTADEKIEKLKSLGVDCVMTLEFDKALSMMTAEEFFKWLREEYDVEFVLVGYNNIIGSDRVSSIEDFQKIAHKLNIEIEKAAKCETMEVSSSIIRKELLMGNVSVASKMLGYYYELSGEIIRGYRNGVKLGFPTANLQLSDPKLVPMRGVYAVLASVEHGEWKEAVCNIGFRPSVSPDGNETIEVHILDFDGDVYGRNLRVHFVERLRDETKFNSIEELKCQLSVDCAQARLKLEKITNRSR